MENKEKKTGKKVLIVIAIIAVILIWIIIGLFVLGTLLDDGEYDDPAVSQIQQDVEIEDVQELEAGQETEDVPDDGTWTVMIYLCGSDLESEGKTACSDLSHMAFAKPSNNINVVVQTGGCKAWHTDEFTDVLDISPIDKDSLGFYHLEGREFKLDKTEPLVSMGEASTLKNFITWGVASYPADRYMLILWDHGGGPLAGVCYDELYNSDYLSVEEFSQAIYDAGTYLDVIGFDACLMASLEIAEALDDYAHYMVASEGVSTGYEYYALLNTLVSDPGDDGLKVSRAIVDSYAEENSDDEMRTMSVLDLTKLPALSEAYSNYSGELLLSTQAAETFRQISQEAAGCVNYGSNSESEGYTDLVDLGCLVKNTKEELGRNTDKILSALNEVVVYEEHGKKRERSQGLSVFYPLKIDDEYIERYSMCSSNPVFYEFLTVLNGEWYKIDWNAFWEEERKTSDNIKAMPDDLFESVKNLEPVDSRRVEIEFYQGFEGDDYKLFVTEGKDMVADVNCLILYVTDDYKVGYLGSDNTVISDYDNGVFTENFNGEWMAVGGEFVYAELVEHGEDYNLYSIPILLNGEKMNMRAAYDYNTYEYTILGVTEGIDEENGQASRGLQDLKEGDEIQFMTYAVDLSGEIASVKSEMAKLGNPITWSDDITMEDKKLGDGNYLYMFRLLNIFNDDTLSEPVVITIENGKVAVRGDADEMREKLQL